MPFLTPVSPDIRFWYNVWSSPDHILGITGELEGLLLAREGQKVPVDNAHPYLQWKYGIFLRGTELMTEVWKAQHHAFSIEQFNQHREVDNMAHRYYQQVGHIDWSKFYEQERADIAIAQHLY
jgi:hypothetical protein